MSCIPAHRTNPTGARIWRAEPVDSAVHSVRRSGARRTNAPRARRVVELCACLRRDLNRATDSPAKLPVTPRSLGTNVDGGPGDLHYRKNGHAPGQTRGDRRGSARDPGADCASERRIGAPRTGNCRHEISTRRARPDNPKRTTRGDRTVQVECRSPGMRLALRLRAERSDETHAKLVETWLGLPSTEQRGAENSLRKTPRVEALRALRKEHSPTPGADVARGGRGSQQEVRSTADSHPHRAACAKLSRPQIRPTRLIAGVRRGDTEPQAGARPCRPRSVRGSRGTDRSTTWDIGLVESSFSRENPLVMSLTTRHRPRPLPSRRRGPRSAERPRELAASCLNYPGPRYATDRRHRSQFCNKGATWPLLRKTETYCSRRDTAPGPAGASDLSSTRSAARIGSC